MIFIKNSLKIQRKDHFRDFKCRVYSESFIVSWNADNHGALNDYSYSLNQASMFETQVQPRSTRCWDTAAFVWAELPHLVKQDLGSGTPAPRHLMELSPCCCGDNSHINLHGPVCWVHLSWTHNELHTQFHSRTGAGGTCGVWEGCCFSHSSIMSD